MSPGALVTLELKRALRAKAGKIQELTGCGSKLPDDGITDAQTTAEPE